MAPFFVRSESSGKKRPAGLLRRAFFPCRRGAVSAEQWGGRRRGSGEGTRADAGLKAAEQTEEETRAGKEQRAGKEYATLHGGSPHGGAD